MNGIVIARLPIGGGSPHAYEPTQRGRGLRPALIALYNWEDQHVADAWAPPAGYLEQPTQGVQRHVGYQ
ncbi:MAG: DNA-binding HxlR family transcriptional regulator [Verrucomicrobiales bacterium]|jgi:DNA-binding HxlR family transcriptional regulator